MEKIMEYLPKKILEKPKERQKHLIDKSDFEEMNDLFYKRKRTAKGWLSWIIGLMLISFWVFMIWGKNDEDDFLPKIIITLIFGLSGILTIIYGFIAPVKYLIFDRLKGVIIMPRNFRSTITMPFSTGFARVKYINSSPGVISAMLGFVSSKDKNRVGGLLAQHNIENFWSFTVWYMDKNRPLPPGTAFDEFRQRDYERRKAAGFPKPIFSSYVPTLEATPEQQAEREKIGGW